MDYHRNRYIKNSVIPKKNSKKKSWHNYVKENKKNIKTRNNNIINQIM